MIPDVEDLKRFLAKPQDISQESNEEKAETLVLHFIGYLAKPIGIEDVLYQKCIKAFNDNRGKVETEIATVLKVLDGLDENERNVQ